MKSKSRQLSLLPRANEPQRKQISIHPTLTDFIEVASLVKEKENIEISTTPENYKESFLVSRERHECEIIVTEQDLKPYCEKFVLFVDEKGKLQFEKVSKSK